MTIKEQAVLAQLKAIIDPDLNQDIVSLNFVKDLSISESGDVSFILELTTPACPVKDLFVRQAETLIKQLEWVKSVQVTLSASKSQPSWLKPAKGLEQVRSIIAVSSCKGGVGKSSVAVNLAFQLALQGASVGLFDADVYGPSLPTMVHTESEQLMMEGGLILPPENRGVKLMSFGFVTAQNGTKAAMLRGPMVSQIINQLLTQTKWGELDYLILDLPPGTGDIHITLSQLIPITGAVVVSTPQQMSYVDVLKGIQMFDALKIPVIALVENMSEFYCSSCLLPHEIFGKGQLDSMMKRFGYAHGFKLPLESSVSESGDSGIPFVIQFPESRSAKRIEALTEAVVRQTSQLLFGKPTSHSLAWENTVFVLKPEFEKTVAASVLRSACRCASCVDEWTGEPLLDVTALPKDLHPTEIRIIGNYAYGIQWSDGHHSLMPFEWVASFFESEKVPN